MNVYKKHIVSEMDERMIQRCIICGEVVSDYSGAAWPAGQSPPKGWPAGELYIRDGFPKVLTTIISEEEKFINCNA